MKKFTKRLTMIVAILLSLVLLTSSIVSTTLAKYVVAKDATTEVGLQAFGLNVTLKTNVSGNKDILNEVTASTQKTGDSISLTYDKVILKPGDDTYKNAILASIGGEATVPAEVIITVKIECNDEHFKLTDANFSDYASPKVYNPIEFYVAGEKCGTAGLKPIATGNDSLKTTSENAIVTKIKGKLTTANGIATATTPAIDSGAYKVTGTINQNTDVNVNNINLGFVWEDANIDNADEISTWISNNENATFTITYTITVQQDTTKPTT